MERDLAWSFRGIPLRALTVFEAAVRHRNMVRAASELGMTQSAVSRQIRQLEDQLRRELFQRGPRGIALTEAGDLLADYVSRGLGELATGLHRLGQPRHRTTIAVVVPRSFALRVLAPRIGSFAQAHAWVDLRIETHRYAPSLERSDVDVAIRLGTGDWSDGAVMPLCEARLHPVCAPALLAAAPSREPALFLRDNVLLHYAERPYWANWLRAARLDPALAGPGPRFGETSLALAAAEAGQGVAMARSIQVQKAVADGRLVVPVDLSVDDGLSYYIVTTERALRRTTVRAFVDWCRDELVAPARLLA